MIENKEKNFVSAVVYLHNDELYVKNFLTNICDVFNRNFEKYEIVCINDYSSDNTVEIVKAFSKTVKNAIISIINMSYYQGLELSMNAGIDLAIGDFVFEFDNIYMDYDVDVIMKVYRRSLEGFDIVSAVPEKKIRSSSKIFYALFNRFSGNQYKLRTETFRILSRRVINRVHSMSKTVPYRKALYANSGLKLEVILYKNINLIPMEFGKVAREKRRDIAIDSLILFTDIAYKAAISMSILMMLVSALIGVYTINIFLSAQPVAGWTTTMLFLAFGFSGVFGVLAIIIKYLALLVDLVFKKKTYTTESIEKLTK